MEADGDSPINITTLTLYPTALEQTVNEPSLLKSTRMQLGPTSRWRQILSGLMQVSVLLVVSIMASMISPGVDFYISINDISLIYDQSS